MIKFVEIIKSASLAIAMLAFQACEVKVNENKSYEPNKSNETHSNSSQTSFDSSLVFTIADSRGTNEHLFFLASSRNNAFVRELKKVELQDPQGGRQDISSYFSTQIPLETETYRELRSYELKSISESSMGQTFERRSEIAFLSLSRRIVAAGSTRTLHFTFIRNDGSETVVSVSVRF